MTDGIRDIKGVDTNPPRGEPRHLGRQHGTPNNEPPEVIRPGKYGDGQDRMGVNVENVHGTARSQRYADGEAHRRAERSQPYPGKR
jgi:hypothetical protein